MLIAMLGKGKILVTIVNIKISGESIDSLDLNKTCEEKRENKLEICQN